MHAVCKKNNHTLTSGKDRQIWLSGNEAVTALNSYPRAKFTGLHRKPVYDCYNISFF